MSSSPMTRDKVASEAHFILTSLKENQLQGRSNKLAEVKSFLEPSCSLDFDSYFFFLRKFHYIAMDREAQLKLTADGESLVEGENMEKFTDEVTDFFADQIVGIGEMTQLSVDVDHLRPPPPVAPDDGEETGPGIHARGRRNTLPPPPPEESGPHSVTPPPDIRSSTTLPPLPPPPPVSMPMPVNAPAAPVPVKGQDLDLRYVKFDPLGAGPLGTVYKGKHNALGVDICVKELKDIFGYFSFLQRGEVIKRLKKELCAQAQVRHPGIVQVLDQNTDVARPYYVMELCKGSLREKLEAAGGKGIDVTHAIRYFLQLSYALRAAHQSGLTHHNVKPENVLFDTYGNAKLTDFGLSRVIEVDQSKGMPQVFVGTGGMGYMSPELISRSKEVGPSSDVYGLGILLYEMVTGQIPGRRSPLPSEVNDACPSKLDPIFDKMTQDRKDKRYADFDAMLDDFYAAFTDGEYLAKGDLLSWSDTPKT